MRRAGIIILIAVLLFSLAFGGEGDVDASMRLLGPSSSHPFGTDALGRDLLERTARGAFVSISIGAISLLISAAVGTVLAYAYSLPRFPRSALLVLADTFKAVPPMVLALFFAAFAGPGIAKMAIAVSIAHISDISRTAYSRTAALLNEEFIEAERSIGAGSARIFFCHILPHVAPYLALQGVSVFLSAVMAESTLSFLGCGVPVDTPSLGALLAEARPVMMNAPWMVAFPAAVLLLIGLSLELIALSFSESDPSAQRSHKRKLVRVAEVSADRKA